MEHTPEQLMDLGIAAYRNRDFDRAKELLQQALDLNPSLWNARLYLAMCHYKSGMLYMSANIFRHIVQNCPDAEIRSKAEAALAPVNREAMESTITNIKAADVAKMQRDRANQAAVGGDDDGSSIEWVQQEAPAKSKK